MRGSIVKRGLHSFACVVYLGRDPATGKERQKWVSFRTKREAEAHLAHLVGQVSSGATLPPAKLRLGEFLERWLLDHGRVALRPRRSRATGPPFACILPRPSGTSPSDALRRRRSKDT